MNKIPEGKKIILFDGICNLCNTTVQKIIKKDSKNSFIFAALQSNIGKKIITKLNIDLSKIDSIILYEQGSSYHIKSSAVLKIMNEFGGFWKVSQILFLLPKPVRDFFYNYIAKNRYKWFGKKDNCIIPSKELKSKFLE